MGGNRTYKTTSRMMSEYSFFSIVVIYLSSLIIAIVLICITKACCSDNKLVGPSSKNKSPADVQRYPSEEDYSKGKDLEMFELESVNANKWF